uniref:Uncharacterized protein n=1 Tax=Panagrellus redivivus TaxID=6233 RepID=A0A7E4ZTJ3_PANRE
MIKSSLFSVLPPQDEKILDVSNLFLRDLTAPFFEERAKEHLCCAQLIQCFALHCVSVRMFNTQSGALARIVIRDF